MTFQTIASLVCIPGTFGGVTPRARIAATVAVAAAAAAAGTAGITLATRQTPEQPKALKARPELVVFPGVRSPAIPALRRAFARWPGTLDEIERLGRARPRDPVVQFNLGVARLYAGYRGDAEQAFRTAKKVGRDTFYEIRADVVLHPQYFSAGYPPFQPTDHDALLLRGARLQARGHQHSAERVFARAARLRPGDDEAQVAAAVARFDMDDLSASFSRLGPLTRRFPHSQSVRFHLGLLLAWTGQREPAVQQFRKARALGPRTTLGREAIAFLNRLEGAGTK
jgi:tetratricopeptide (TPR) repeat protein